MNASLSEFLHGEFFALKPQYTEDDLLGAFATFYSKYLSSQEFPKAKQELLFEAFTHKSFAHESKIKLSNNERLEFLGDSVLQLAVSEAIFERYSNEPEGRLSKLRSSIVNEKALSDVALYLGLDKLLMLGKGELKENGHKKPSLVSNCFEAVLGAIYKSEGFEMAKSQALLTFEIYGRAKKDLFDINSLSDFDAKSALQELLVRERQDLPRYTSEEVQENGVPKFKIKVSIKGEVLGEIEHASKKKGMQALAKIVLEKIKNK